MQYQSIIQNLDAKSGEYAVKKYLMHGTMLHGIGEGKISVFTIYM